MAFQSKDALGGDFSRAFNRQMNSKRRMRVVSLVAPEGRDFPQRFRRTRNRVGFPFRPGPRRVYPEDTAPIAIGFAREP